MEIENNGMDQKRINSQMTNVSGLAQFTNDVPSNRNENLVKKTSTSNRVIN